MNVNIRVSRFEISRFVCFFLIMEFSDGEGLSQLYLELFDGYKKRFIPQNENYRIDNDVPEITHGPESPLFDNIEPVWNLNAHRFLFLFSLYGS